jgi:aryl-alcohol dehydrogenase-like predicted oxidoreductase
MKRTSINEKDNSGKTSRRDFLKTSTMIGTGLCIPVTVSNLTAQTTESAGKNNNESLKRRVLGTGKAALEVSAIGFGCMGMSYNRGLHPDKKACICLLHEAVDKGITLFDTAQGYGSFMGENEELLSEAISQFKSKINITTKFGHSYVNGKHQKGVLDSRPENIRQVAEDALKRLKIDTIAIFYQHRFDPNIPIEDVAGTVKDLIREGKVLHFGLCEVSPQTIRKAHAVQPITAVQSEYSLMWKLQEENGVLLLCEELGIGFVPYSPLGRGFLGGGINEYTKFDAKIDNRATLPRFTPEAIRTNTRLIETLNTFGRTRGITSAQISLAWLLAQKPWIVPIPGTTKPAHLDENLRATEIVLTPDDIRELNKAVSQIEITGNRYSPDQEKLVGH